MQEFTKKEQNEGKRKGYIFLALAIFCILLTITLIILAYVPYFSHLNSEWEECDGLGRMLDEVPPALSIILPQWAGYIWFIIDCLLLLAMIVIIDKLFVKSRIYFKGIKNVDF